MRTTTRAPIAALLFLAAATPVIADWATNSRRSGSAMVNMYSDLAPYVQGLIAACLALRYVASKGSQAAGLDLTMYLVGCLVCLVTAHTLSPLLDAWNDMILSVMLTFLLVCGLPFAPIYMVAPRGQGETYETPPAPSMDSWVAPHHAQDERTRSRGSGSDGSE
jgi:hypothetical protein